MGLSIRGTYARGGLMGEVGRTLTVYGVMSIVVAVILTAISISLVGC